LPISSTNPRWEEENRSLIDGEQRINELPAPGEDQSEDRDDTVKIAIVDDLAKSFARVDLSIQQSFHILAVEFHNEQTETRWGKSENLPGEFPGKHLELGMCLFIQPRININERE
jgi:hypothetical protein